MATGQAPRDADPEADKNPAAVSLGRLGGLKGGKARAKALSAQRRKAIATRPARPAGGPNQSDAVDLEGGPVWAAWAPFEMEPGGSDREAV